MTPWISRLLMANVIVFLLQMSLPAVSGGLALVPAALLQRPWTILTYMFAHGGVSHILFNMLSLWIFGPRVELTLGGKIFIRLYLISGIVGGLLSLLVTPYAQIVGASGAIFGVQLAFAKFFPRERIFIWGVLPVEARVLVVIMTAISLFGGLSGGGNTAHFAHLGGYVGAWLYLKFVESRLPSKQWEKKLAGPPASAITIGDWRSVDINAVNEYNRDEVKRILDKISAAGEGSLTSQERVFLGHFTKA